MIELKQTPLYSVGDKVRKVGGTYEADGVIVGVAETTRGDIRYVFEFDSPSGMLHMKPMPADGVKGCLIRSFEGTYYFRVYDADHNFVDYDLHHSDLNVTITDPDAFFYSGDGVDRLDHAPATLGIDDTTS